MSRMQDTAPAAGDKPMREIGAARLVAKGADSRLSTGPRTPERIGRWEAPAERLEGRKALEPTERHLAANLMGERHDDPFDPAVARMLAAYLGAARIEAEEDRR